MVAPIVMSLHHTLHSAYQFQSINKRKLYDSEAWPNLIIVSKLFDDMTLKGKYKNMFHEFEYRADVS